MQLTRSLLGLIREFALPLTAPGGSALILRRTTALTLGFLLLSACELLEPLEQLVHLIVGLLLLSALDRLVLILQLVQLQLEEIREILRGLLTASTPASASLLLLFLDVAFVGLFRLLKKPKGFLLVGESLSKRTIREIFLNPRHGLEGLG